MSIRPLPPRPVGGTQVADDLVVDQHAADRVAVDEDCRPADPREPGAGQDHAGGVCQHDAAVREASEGAAAQRHVAAAVHQHPPLAAGERAAAHRDADSVFHAQQETRAIRGGAQFRAAEVQPDVLAIQQDRLVHRERGGRNFHRPHRRVAQEGVEFGSPGAVENPGVDGRGGVEPRAGRLQRRVRRGPRALRRTCIQLERAGPLADLQFADLRGQSAVGLVARRRQLEARAQVPRRRAEFWRTAEVLGWRVASKADRDQQEGAQDAGGHRV